MDHQEIFATCVKSRQAREILASSFSQVRKQYRDKLNKLAQLEQRLYAMFDEDGQLPLFGEDESQLLSLSPEMESLLDDPLGDEMRPSE